jgi:dipeptidase
MKCCNECCSEKIRENKTRENKTRQGHWSCTTIAIGKEATVDGSVIVAHSDDDVSDVRVIYVPAADYPDGAMRPVYYDDASLGHNPQYNSTELRRYVGTSRGPGYNTVDYLESRPLGEIPQVRHTYAYFDYSYGIMNEKQLMIGECTCGAKFHPEPEPGKNIFYSSELSRVALERCSTAKGAVELIGELIEKYGLYGTGETLLIGDPDEVWVIEMCGYKGEVGSKFSENGTGGLWVAQRVPDTEFFVAANQFRIRDIHRDQDKNSKDLMHSANLFDVCINQDWLDPSATELDWVSTVSWGEYSHPYYSLRRVWRAQSKVAPDLKLSPWVEDGYTRAYPFSVKPDKKLSVADVAAIYRDHYEGTEFDLSKGRAAGPFGDPTRYENNPDKGDSFNLNTYYIRGAWERPLSIYRCGVLWINQGRKFLPDPIGGISWIGLDRPEANCLMPFYAGVNKLPESFETINISKFDRNSDWWAFNVVANYATIKYSYMMQDIRETQQELEGATYYAVDNFEKEPGKKSSDDLTAFCENNAKNTVSEWWNLLEKLIVKYNDGCITTENEIMQKVGYPDYWLKDVGYDKGPVRYDKIE